MSNSKIKILLVDDMDIIIDIIISHLKTIGQDFIYLKAHNGRDACKIASQNIPDLIIMDWEMPKMNGIDALGLLKKNKLLKDIPVIISSGFSDSINVRKAMDAGAIDYIRKPIDSIELIARVKSVLTLQNNFNELKKKQIEFEIEKSKVEKMLEGLMPAKILEEIKQTGTSRPKRYKNASVIFIDLVDFTIKSKQMSPKRLINELNDIFSSFDKIMTKNQCTRIKTIGDAYLAVCGLPEEDAQHHQKIINAAFLCMEFITRRNTFNPIKWELRIGINSGDIIGSLIGFENYLFDVFGETVNTASRIQSHINPMVIACGKNTYEQTKNDYIFESCGNPNLKGLGEVGIYRIIEEKSISNSSEAFLTEDLTLSPHNF